MRRAIRFVAPRGSGATSACTMLIVLHASWTAACGHEDAPASQAVEAGNSGGASGQGGVGAGRGNAGLAGLLPAGAGGTTSGPGAGDANASGGGGALRPDGGAGAGALADASSRGVAGSGAAADAGGDGDARESGGALSQGEGGQLSDSGADTAGRTESGIEPRSGHPCPNEPLGCWRPMSAAPQMLKARAGALAVWTGTEAVIWGGNSRDGTLRNGARYDPVRDTWVEMSGADNEEIVDRACAAAIWLGELAGGGRLLIWGGSNVEGDVGLQCQVLLYDPWLASCPAMRRTRY